MKKFLLAGALPLVATAVFASRPIEVNIMHINDHHSHLEPETLSFKIGGKSTKVKIGGYPEVMREIR